MEPAKYSYCITKYRKGETPSEDIRSQLTSERPDRAMKYFQVFLLQELIALQEVLTKAERKELTARIYLPLPSQYIARMQHPGRDTYSEIRMDVSKEYRESDSLLRLLTSRLNREEIDQLDTIMEEAMANHDGVWISLAGVYYLY